MPHLLPLGLQVAFVVGIRLHLDGHLPGDLQAVAFEPHDFTRIVRQQTDGFQAEVAEDLCAEAVFAQIHLEAEFLVRFHGVVALLLQFVGLNLRRETNAAAFLAHVEDHPTAGVGDLAHGRMQLWSAVAPA